MVKQKRKRLAAVVVKSNSSQNSMENPLNIVDPDLSSEDNWVIVKKQRVNIWIPPLPSTEPSTLLDPGLSQLPVDMCSNSTNTATQLPDENPPEVCLAERNDESLTLSPKTNVCSVQEVYPPADNVVATVKLSKLSPPKMSSDHRVTASSALHKKKRSIVHKTSSCLRLNRSVEQCGLYRISNIATTTTFRDRMMKAANLERKIVRAGGLDRWLFSLGLEQFMRIFRGKKINKFQLANLSMKKLKDMGAHAVGPRRKLIHAIECAILF